MSVVLVAVDGSASGERAVVRAAELAHERGAEVLVLHVVPTTFVRDRNAQIDPNAFDDEEAFAWGVVDRALALLGERGVRAQGRVLEGAPAQAILEQVAEVRPSVVVMGSRGRRAVLREGSVSERVRARAGVDVVVVE